MVLSKGHGAGVEPAVNDVLDPCHGLSTLRASQVDVVHVGAVKLDVLTDVLNGSFGQLSSGADRCQLAAVFIVTAPDGQRRSPVTAS